MVLRNDNPIKDSSVARKVTSGIDHRHLDPMSIFLESQNVFQCLFLDPVFDRYNIVDFGEDGRAPEIRILARPCKLEKVDE